MSTKDSNRSQGKSLPSLPATSEHVDIKKMTLRELQEAIDRERKLLQSKSALLSKLPDKGARIKQKLIQMEVEEQSRLQSLQSEATKHQFKKQSDVLQHVEFAVRSLSSDSARRLAEVVRSSLAEETENFVLEDFDEEEEAKQKRRMEEEEEEESVAAVLQMLATSQISQNVGKQFFDVDKMTENVPRFAKKCAELSELHPPGKHRFVLHRFSQSTVPNTVSHSPEHSSNSLKKEKKKTNKWDESLKTPDWTFNEAKPLKMEESFDLIAHLSNATKGLNDKLPVKTDLSSTSDGRILNAFRTLNDAATVGAHFQIKTSQEVHTDTSDEEGDLEDILEEDHQQDVDNLGDLINSTLTLT